MCVIIEHCLQYSSVQSGCLPVTVMTMSSTLTVEEQHHSIHLSRYTFPSTPSFLPPRRCLPCRLASGWWLFTTRWLARQSSQPACSCMAATQASCAHSSVDHRQHTGASNDIHTSHSRVAFWSSLYSSPNSAHVPSHLRHSTSAVCQHLSPWGTQVLPVCQHLSPWGTQPCLSVSTSGPGAHKCCLSVSTSVPGAHSPACLSAPQALGHTALPVCQHLSPWAHSPACLSAPQALGHTALPVCQHLRPWGTQPCLSVSTSAPGAHKCWLSVSTSGPGNTVLAATLPYCYSP